MKYTRCESLTSTIKEVVQYRDRGLMQGAGGRWKRADRGKKQNGDNGDSSLFSTKHCGIKSKALQL